MIQARKRFGERVPWLAPLVVWGAWACAGYVLMVRALTEVRAIEWQATHPALDWIVHQEVSGQVGFLVTLVLLAAWCAGAYPLYRWTVSPRRGR